MAKPLAKSLHTITVLVRVSRYLIATEYYTVPTALSEATKLLGLDTSPDVYGLVAAALKQLGGK